MAQWEFKIIMMLIYIIKQILILHAIAHYSPLSYNIVDFSSLLSNQISQPEEKRAAATIGILQGGGALVGVDPEVLATGRFGIQAGAGKDAEPG